MIMQYVIAGIGGQGILFTSKVLGQIALSKGTGVMGSEVHGMSQRGGSVISHYKTGDHFSPLVQKGEADVLLAFDQTEALRNYDFLKDGGHAIVNVHDRKSFSNSDLEEFFQDRDIKIHILEGYEILKEHMQGSFLFLNVLMLGAMCGKGLGDVSLEDVKKTVEELSPERFREPNLKSVDLGYRAMLKV